MLWYVQCFVMRFRTRQIADRIRKIFLKYTKFNINICRENSITIQTNQFLVVENFTCMIRHYKSDKIAYIRCIESTYTFIVSITVNFAQNFGIGSKLEDIRKHRQRGMCAKYLCIFNSIIRHCFGTIYYVNHKIHVPQERKISGLRTRPKKNSSKLWALYLDFTHTCIKIVYYIDASLFCFY